jgi:hypothetical protein
VGLGGLASINSSELDRPQPFGERLNPLRESRETGTLPNARGSDLLAEGWKAKKENAVRVGGAVSPPFVRALRLRQTHCFSTAPPGPLLQ